jgi:hypothetical protein
MSEKGSTLGRDPSLSCEREQRSEGRLILARLPPPGDPSPAQPQTVIAERRQGTLVRGV